jgi:hypothetical protein
MAHIFRIVGELSWPGVKVRSEMEGGILWSRYFNSFIFGMAKAGSSRTFVVSDSSAYIPDDVALVHTVD